MWTGTAGTTRSRQPATGWSRQTSKIVNQFGNSNKLHLVSQSTDSLLFSVSRVERLVIIIWGGGSYDFLFHVVT